jgi:myo-inositol-1(or 4)-monophosphatase
MPDLLDLARNAASAGAAVIAQRRGSVGPVRTKSSSSDLVTDVDVASGVAVVRTIAEALPPARFVVEEAEVYDLAGVAQGDTHDAEVWVIDPLDGTTSYVHGFPCYSVSVALVRDGKPAVAAVFNVPAGEMFSAEAGGGATLDGSPIHCSAAETIETSLLVTGFPYDRGATLDRQLAIFDRAVRLVHGIRRDGSAAIDCCHVAAGRADGFWELALKPWDTAAGVLIAAEAGAVVTDLRGDAWTIDTADHLMAGPELHPVLVEFIGAG